MTGPFPSRGLVRPGQQLDRVSQVTVPGDRTVVIPVETDDLGQKMSISGVALGAGSRMPLSIPRRGQRVDREHLILRLNPGASGSFLGISILRGFPQVRPG